MKTLFTLTLCLAAFGCESSPSSRVDGLPMGLDIGFVDQLADDAPARDASLDTDGPLPAEDVVGLDLSPPDQDVDTTQDSGTMSGACPIGIPTSTVALYTFDGSWGRDRVEDETGDHDGTSVGNPAKIASLTNCGSAMSFPTGAYATLPPSNAWALSVGSVSLWARFGSAATNVTQGVLSRDASNNATGSQQGHFTIFRDGKLGGRIIVRLQDAAKNWYVFCSNQVVPEDTWTEIGVNFGAPQVELYVDGQRADNSDVVTLTLSSTYQDIPCNPSYAGGIDGNNEPWLLGASATSSDENSVLPTNMPMTGGAIDHLRISSARGDFSQ